MITDVMVRDAASKFVKFAHSRPAKTAALISIGSSGWQIYLHGMIMSVPLVIISTSIGVITDVDGRIPRFVTRCITSLRLNIAQNQKIEIADIINIQ